MERGNLRDFVTASYRGASCEGNCFAKNMKVRVAVLKFYRHILNENERRVQAAQLCMLHVNPELCVKKEGRPQSFSHPTEVWKRGSWLARRAEISVGVLLPY